MVVVVVRGQLNGGNKRTVVGFDYDKAVKPKTKVKGVRQSSPERSLETLNIPQLKSAKSRYIFHNYARRKTGQQFIAHLSEALAAATKGVAVEHQRPGR